MTISEQIAFLDDQIVIMRRNGCVAIYMDPHLATLEALRISMQSLIGFVADQILSNDPVMSRLNAELLQATRDLPEDDPTNTKS